MSHVTSRARPLGAPLLAGRLVETHPPGPPPPLSASLKQAWPADPWSGLSPPPERRTLPSPSAMAVRRGCAPAPPSPRPCRGGPPGGDSQAGGKSLPELLILPGDTLFPLAALPRPEGGAGPLGPGVGVGVSQHFPPPAGAACVRPAPSDRRERGAARRRGVSGA